MIKLNYLTPSAAETAGSKIHTMIYIQLAYSQVEGKFRQVLPGSTKRPETGYELVCSLLPQEIADSFLLDFYIRYPMLPSFATPRYPSLGAIQDELLLYMDEGSDYWQHRWKLLMNRQSLFFLLSKVLK